MQTCIKPKFTFSLDYLANISDNDTDFMIDLMDLFLIQTPLEINLILEAIKVTDYANIYKYCHKIKPTFLMFGFAYANNLFNVLENDAKQQIDIFCIKEKFIAFLPLLNQLYIEIQNSKASFLRQ